MTVEACAALVARGDPDRFAATMAAPPALRPRLWPLYAVNLELARAAWVSPEPLVCQMRLQWWVDTLLGMGQGAPKAHEVAGPLDALVTESGLPVDLLAGMAEARFWDTAPDPFADTAALWGYLDQTAGNLMWAAALALGAAAPAEATVRSFAQGAGLASWFCATAELMTRNRQPLPDTSSGAIRSLARDGLARIDTARRLRHTVPAAARPALFPGWQAAGLLRQAVARPDRVLSGRLGISEFSRRGGLAWCALTGRF